MERGLGKVLFVDEAYRLAEGMFAQEAVNELVDTMTKPKFAGKLVIILAGYDNDMNNLLRANEGLSSRFADEIIFPSLTPENCLQLLEARLRQTQIALPWLQDPTTYQQLLDPIVELSKLPSWGNARDVQTLAKSMVRAVYQTNTSKVAQLILPAEAALKCIRNMLADRRARANSAPTSRPSLLEQAQQMLQTNIPQAPRTSFNSSTAIKSATKEEAQPAPASQILDHSRDAGVSDAVWEQLQKDKKIMELQAQSLEKMIREQEESRQVAEEAEKAVTALKSIQAKDEAEALELLRQREEARIREIQAMSEKERIERELEKQRLEKKREAVAQQKLREMGICPAGFRWVKQSGGYRCTAGGHWVADSQLGM